VKCPRSESCLLTLGICRVRPGGHSFLPGIRPGVMQVDFANAFNSIFRAALVAAVSQRQPQLLPLVTWLYGQHSNLWVVGAPPDTPPVHSQKGVRQGDPVGAPTICLHHPERTRACRFGACKRKRAYPT
jgi:hypothetical protein